jgi:hypothetical protein
VEGGIVGHIEMAVDDEYGFIGHSFALSFLVVD